MNKFERWKSIVNWLTTDNSSYPSGLDSAFAISSFVQRDRAIEQEQAQKDEHDEEAHHRVEDTDSIRTSYLKNYFSREDIYFKVLNPF